MLSNAPGIGVTTTTPTTTDGGAWLNVKTSFSSGGTTPGTITVSVDPSKLGPNTSSTYSGQVNISAPGASPTSATVNVTFQVSSSQVPQLALTPLAPQSFALPQGGQSQGAVVVSNTGGGALSYNVLASSNTKWLSLPGAEVGIIAPSTPASISFTVSAVGLSPGLYQGTITATDLDSRTSQSSIVALLVNDGSQPTMQLSQTGLTFYAVANTTVAPPEQSLAMFNLGTGAYSWSTQILYSSTNQSWLTVTPLSVSSSAGAPGEATISVNPAGLLKGQYYATVNVKSAAVNSPQSLSVLLNVVGAGELGSGPQVSASGMILAAATGSTAAPRTINLYSPSAANLNYSTSKFTSDGGDWLSVTPTSGSLGVAGTTLTIQASAAVTVGVHFGTVQVAFNEGTVQTIQVILVATPGVTSKAMLSSNSGEHGAAATSCTPTTLVATFSKPAAGAQLHVGLAQTFQVQIVDSPCANPLLPSQSSNSYLDVNGAQINLTSPNSDGYWTGSWTPSSPQLDVPVRVFASRLQALAVDSVSTPVTVLDVTVLAANTDSAAQPAGAINGASFDKSNPGFVVPGGYVSIFGDRMADAVAQGNAPLPCSLGDVKLLLGGNCLPLLSVNANQVNGLIPQSVPLYTNIQLVVQRANTMSVPVSAYVTDLQPGIFTRATSGQGQGSILIARTATVAGPSGSGQQPVSRGQYISIYATGLGAVVASDGSRPPADGQPAAESGTPLYTTVATATVTIGGVSAPVVFAGLAPGYVALYQVNALVPSNALVGSAVEVVLTMIDSNGNPVPSQRKVTIAVQ